MLPSPRAVAALASIVALVLIVAAVAIASNDSNALPLVIGLTAPTVVGILNLFKTADNARALNGAMDRHLENVKQVGTTVGTEAAAHAVSVTQEEAKAAIREAAVAAVNQIMLVEITAARDAKARATAAGKTDREANRG